MKNILTFDLEDWYQTYSYSKKIPVSRWDGLEGRLDKSVPELLGILSKAGTKATFFVLAFNAKRYSMLLRSIRKEGHELALHGYSHKLVFSQSRKEFREESDYSRKLLEDLTGVRIKGFRAPNWSVNGGCLWALEELKGMGFLYDSSLNEDYFLRIKAGFPRGMIEIPRSCFAGIPFAGGAFLRFFPYLLTRTLARIRNRQGVRFMAYMHPWEFDRFIPDIKPPLRQAVLNGFRLSSSRRILESLLSDFEFDSIENIFFKEKNDG